MSPASSSRSAISSSSMKEGTAAYAMRAAVTVPPRRRGSTAIDRIPSRELNVRQGEVVESLPVSCTTTCRPVRIAVPKGPRPSGESSQRTTMESTS